MFSALKKSWIVKPVRNVIKWYSRIPLKKRFFWMTYQKNWMIDPCSEKRQKYWKKCGVHATGNFNVGADVYFDAQNAHMLTIEEGVWISSRCTILCHKRDINSYYLGDVYRENPVKSLPVRICKNAAIGMNCTIMPGVVIGEGAVIGTGSLVTKDIPAWSVAVGRPAKVVKKIITREEAERLKEVEIQ